jgi:hypothetical protein
MAMATELVSPRSNDDALDDDWTEASLRAIDAAERRHSLPRGQSAEDHLGNSAAAAGASGINIVAAAEWELDTLSDTLDARLQELDPGLIRTNAAFRHCRVCFGLLKVHHAESGHFVGCSNFAAAAGACPYTRSVQEPGTPQELGCDAPTDLHADVLNHLADLWYQRRAVEADFEAGKFIEWAQLAARCRPLQLQLARGAADQQAVRRAAAALELTVVVGADGGCAVHMWRDIYATLASPSTFIVVWRPQASSLRR